MLRSFPSILVFFFIGINTYSQQSSEVSQYILHQPFINTASIAKSGAKNGAFIFKQNWIGYEGAPSSLFMNFNMPLRSPKRFGGIIKRHLGVSDISRDRPDIDDRAAQLVAELHGQHADHRQQRIAQCLAGQQSIAAKPLGAGSPDVVRLECLDQPGSGQTHHRRHRAHAEHERWQHEVCPTATTRHREPVQLDREQHDHHQPQPETGYGLGRYRHGQGATRRA